MTQRNLLGTALFAAATIWFGIFAFLALRPNSTQEPLPTRAVLPTSVAVVDPAAESQATELPTLTAVPVQTLPTTIPATSVPTALPVTETVETDDTADAIEPIEEVIAEETIVEDQIILQFAPDASAEERAAQIAAIGGTVQSEISALDTVVVNVADADAVEITSAAVLHTEPNYYAYALTDYSIPVSDPLATQQWSLEPTNVIHLWNDVPETNVTVAVLDSGICASHPDLSGRVLNGWDYVDNDANPNDTFGHGCGVSSVIAANIDNGVGMAGIAPNAIILPLRVLNSYGSGSYSDVAQGIIDATDQGADIINLSLGGSASSSMLQNAVQYAVNRGVIVIAAAGNDGENRALYPAAYNGVISVGAVDQNLNRAVFSNYGSQIDVWAPGVSIVTAYLNGGYAMQNGTSFAAPIVSGIAAMELALGRELDLSGDVISIPEWQEEIVQAPTETSTSTPTTEPAPGNIRDGSPQGLPTRSAAPVASDLWVVRLEAGSDPAAVAASLGFEYVQPLASLPNTYIFRFAGSDQQAALATSAVNALNASAQVADSQQQYYYQAVVYTVPSENGLSSQWHLNNTGQSGGTVGVDVNAFDAWNIDLGGGNYVDGGGVVIAIVDDGLQYTHPGIAPNYLASTSYDLVDDDTDPAPILNYIIEDISYDDSHGTSVGGIAAGAVDGSCGVGAAYGAQVSGLRLLGYSEDLQKPSGISDFMLANAESYAYSVNDIYNNSWGFIGMIGPDEFPFSQDALEFGIENGRGGLGTIYTWASGNDLRVYYPYYQEFLYFGYNVNNSWPANSRYTIAVGAVNHNGIQSFYSTPGAALLVSAPSSGKTAGTYTTDLIGGDGQANGNCTNQFGGTSSASPLVAGVIGLVLEANPTLTWRDVQHILVETSTKIDQANLGESSNWATNAAGYAHSDAYGFGMIDAEAAVNAALTWENVVPEMSVSSAVSTVDQAIPDGSGAHDFDNGASGAVYGAAVTDTIYIPDDIIIEHVEVTFDATIFFREHLYVTLTSPDGTTSVLTNPHYFTVEDDLEDFDNWPFMTVKNWGEMSAGNWTISVQDGYSGTTGTFNHWSLKIYGRIPEPTEFTAEALSSTETEVRWSYAGTESVDLVLEVSDDAINWTEEQTLTSADTSTTYTMPACNQSYYFRLRAVHPTQDAYSKYTDIEEVLCDPFDHLATAPDLGTTLPINASYDMTGFSEGIDPIPSCGHNPTATLWYTFTPSATGTYRMTTTGSAINTVLSVWEDDGGMTELDCDNDSGSGTTSSLRLGLEAGTTYFITIAGNDGAGGEISLNIEQLAEPTNTPEPTLTLEPTDTPEPERSTVGIVNPTGAFWRFRDTHETGNADVSFNFGYAGSDWVPIVGDWNQDGIDGIGIYRRGVWLLRDTTEAGSIEIAVNFGPAEDGWQPVAGDWDGDQYDGIGLYKDGTWLLRNDLYSSWRDQTIRFERFDGMGIPVAGDWNNDGFDTTGLFYQGSWALRTTNESASAVTMLRFGDASSPWQPIVGDWNQDGFDTVGIFSNGLWYLANTISEPRIDTAFEFGSSGIPVANYRGSMDDLAALSIAPIVEVPTATSTTQPAASATMIVPSATPTLTATPTLAAPSTSTATQTPLPTLTATPTTTPSVTTLPSATASATEVPAEPTAETTQEP